MSKTYQKGLAEALRLAPVVPVMVIERVEDAVPLARALVKGGLPVLEITLRTATAMESIRAIIAEVEGAIVGSGTVLTPEQLRDSHKLGCKFAVSPGATGRLLGAAEDYEIDFLPGGVTASEAMALLEWGYAIQKFFPAEPAGGAAYLSALASPLPQVSFCPTGGITPEKAPAYLKLPNVITVGGSWMAPKTLVEAKDWAAIEKLAADASRLRKG
ncbi:bifunctional 4-hydroxy-2-oxoglutarate aldolase/2-dehydro-3-deoxy-phosphogluconate aldolase [Aestuariivirga sp.]|jgi:2-dehydro-3-deoxyphosphogluconate aldolase/(4S)-4-hydroxy-2-oxoglutarate aldolase|uniref:bifunctional 4-hydroxy-2-oxoglutarate aldolase/2-dehydro-3-deoxy-phosphogluconate aldolase n=1 Tax=Aestuariivirga sp. TaxID=2650926 RepID=UPI003784534C